MRRRHLSFIFLSPLGGEAGEGVISELGALPSSGTGSRVPREMRRRAQLAAGGTLFLPARQYDRRRRAGLRLDALRLELLHR